jgi:diguanylate cyclase (GGDEF)-like protein
MSGSSDTDSGELYPDGDTGPSTRHVKWTEVIAEKAEERPAEAPPEANIILISHPEDQLLGRRWHLRSGIVMEIGRSTSCDVSLPEALSVSRRHARLRFKGPNVTLEDLGSTNGTYVNDEQITRVTTLRSGDRFQVGTVHFKFLQEFDVEHAYYETLYQLAVRDGLTEIFNKRKFGEELEREFQRSIRYARPLSLILFDLDHFKAVNDTHGHLCGDHVLQEAARLVARYLRPEQTLARVGGEEFAVLSPEMDAAGALQMAEKIRRQIEVTRFVFAGVPLSVTCSFGVAERRPSMKASQELFEAADRALYRAKGEGRNCVSVADVE